MTTIYKPSTERVDLEPFFRGDYWPIHINLTDESGELLSLAGIEFTLTLKKSPYQETPDLVTTGGYQEGDEDDTQVFLISDSDKTKDLIPITYFYDIQAFYQGITTTIASGRVRCKADITRGES